MDQQAQKCNFELTDNNTMECLVKECASSEQATALLETLREKICSLGHGDNKNIAVYAKEELKVTFKLVNPHGLDDWDYTLADAIFLVLEAAAEGLEEDHEGESEASYVASDGSWVPVDHDKSEITE